MARKSKFKHFSLMVPQGGQLIAGSNSQDTAGSANYVEKINFRRETDGEVRREGWTRLTLSEIDELDTADQLAELPNQGTLDENLPIRLLTQFSSNEKLILIAGSGNSIYSLEEDVGAWKKIASNVGSLDLSGGGKHWETVVIDGFLILNNGYDLPLIYRQGWTCAFPMYSLRERGIVRVGTMSDFDGRLFLGDVTYIEEQNGDEVQTQLQSAQPYGRNIVVPTYRIPHIIEFSAWRLTDQSTDAKAAPYLFGQNYNATIEELVNDQITKLKLPFYLGGAKEADLNLDVKSYINPYHEFTQSEYENYDFSNTTIVAGDTIRFSVTDQAQVTNVYDAKVVSITANQATNSTTIEVRDAYNNTTDGVLTSTGNEQSGLSQTLAVEDTAVIVLLKEPDIFNIDSNIAREASDSLSFPEDGSRILKMARLGDKLVVHRETGYLLISKGDRLSAFYFEDRYKGERVADMRHTVININDQRQLFVGYNGVFTITPSSVEPEIMTPLMMGPEFWRLVTNKEIEYVYSVENSITQEIFTVCPIGYTDDESGNTTLNWGVMAYDLLQGTVSQIDYAFTAMTNTLATVNMPSKRFLMGSHLTQQSVNPEGGYSYYFPSSYIPDYRFKDTEVISEEALAKNLGTTNLGARIMRYGYGASEELRGPFRVFSRDGADYKCILKFGKSDFGDRFSEKKLRSYALHMSDIFQYKIYVSNGYATNDYTDAAVNAEAKVTSFATAQVEPIEEIIETLEDLSNQVMVPMFAQGNYYQDTLTLTGSGQPFKVIGRTFEVSGVSTKLTNQSIQDGS